MLQKRDLKEFYTRVASINSIFNTITKSNQKLEDELALSETKKGPTVTLPNKPTHNALKYIIRHVSNVTIKEAIVELFDVMVDMEFEKISSVPNHVPTNSEKNTCNIRAKVNLFNHTINIMTEAIDICEHEPSATRDIVILLALLHDFGKCAKLVETYSLSNATPHEANFSIFLYSFTA
ncbi:MAG: HD domain-containing protein [Sulfurospirillum sp.]|nr:HD domain-containing protein [Sulfurospirillum sp.]